MLDFMMVMVHDRTSIPTAKKLMWLLKGGNLSYTDFPAATLWMANKMNHSEFSMFKMFCDDSVNRISRLISIFPGHPKDR